MLAAISAMDRCLELARFTEEPGHITRTFLSPPMHDVHDRVACWMEAAGCRVSVDAAGNIHGRYEGTDPFTPPLLIGSHLDTVPRAGAFDGILGVTTAIGLVESLQGRRLACPIQVIGFSEEEGVRYGVPFIGSRAALGLLDLETARLISEAVQDFGLNPARLGEARIAEAAGYLEIHIEQGPVLESLGLPLGIVEAIAGQSRLTVTFEGAANHAGTTPMHLRRDALAAASEWILAVEQEALNTAGLVATVGKLTVEPNGTNVVPGTVIASLDVRHAAHSIRCGFVEKVLAAAAQIASHRNAKFRHESRMNQGAVSMDPAMTRRLEEAVKSAGFPTHRMTSGAGHDAMVVAQRFPVAMLFVRSPGGISHHPDEAVLAEDVGAALAAGLCFLEQYA